MKEWISLPSGSSLMAHKSVGYVSKFLGSSYWWIVKDSGIRIEGVCDTEMQAKNEVVSALKEFTKGIA